MPTARTKRKSPDKDLLTRLAEAGEEALSRVGELPGGQRLVETVNGLRERLDELQSRLRSLDPLERRVTALEQRLAALEGKSRPATRRKPKGPQPPPA
jgi:polyhydroxyalkanoate synthesis regulator phasin